MDAPFSQLDLERILNDDLKELAIGSQKKLTIAHHFDVENHFLIQW